MVLLTVSLLIAWSLFATLLVPVLIQRAYEGTLPSIFTDLLRRRTEVPVEHYLVRARNISTTVFVLLALGGVALLATTRSGVRQWLDRRLPKHDLPDSAYVLPVTRRRRLVANLVIAILVGGHLFAIVTGTEEWPFSPYAMFSTLAPGHRSVRLALVGAVDTGEVPLNAPNYFDPFDPVRLQAAMERLQRRPDADVAVERALRELGIRYERLRQAGAHHGPRLLAIKLVEESRALDRRAANVQPPDSIRVLHEVRLVGRER